MRLHDIRFDGHLLERGFWLYVWRISCRGQVVLYVGRTGDSSSHYAASPFSRLSQHLDVRPSAKANTLLCNIRKKGFDPLVCSYELLSIGPLFAEQPDLAKHRRYRDIVASLEAALAEHMRQIGYEVMGIHPHSGPIDTVLFNEILSLLQGRL